MIYELYYINHWINSGNPSFMVQNKLLPEWLNPESAKLFDFVRDYCNKYGKPPTHRLMKENFDQYVEFESADLDPPKAIIESIKGTYVDSKITPILTKMVESSREPLSFVESVRHAIVDMQDVVSRVSSGTDLYSWVKSSLDRYDQYMQTHGNDGVRGYPTGLGTIDEIIGGITGDDLLLVTARMGEGKSLVGDYIGYNVWNYLVKNNIKNPILCINTEMTVKQVAYRLDTLKFHISNNALRFGKVADTDAYKEYLERLSTFDTDYYIVTQDLFGRNITPMDIASMIEEKSPAVVIIDQLYDINDGTGEKDIRKRIVNVSNSLRRINLEYGVPFVVMAQAGRESAKAVKKDPNATPELDQIQESDNPAQKATKVLALRLSNDIMTMALKKNRDGQKGDNVFFKVDIDKGLWMEMQEATVNF